MKSKEIEIKLPKNFYINKDGIMVSEITLEDLNNIIDYLDESQRINLDLVNRIDKAIKYIKKNIPYWQEWHYDGVIDTDDMNIIIDILKGDKNV